MNAFPLKTVTPANYSLILCRIYSYEFRPGRKSFADASGYFETIGQNELCQPKLAWSGRK